MSDIALEIRKHLAGLHKSSNFNVEVNRSSQDALNGDSRESFVTTVSSHLIQTISGWCRSSYNRNYFTVYDCEDDMVWFMANAGHYALCLFDDRLRIWSSSAMETAWLASQASQAFSRVIAEYSLEENVWSNETLDNLTFEGDALLKSWDFRQWLDLGDEGQREVADPFPMERESIEEPDASVTRIYMHPPTPRLTMLTPSYLSPISPFSSSDCSLSPGSTYDISPFSSQSSTTSSLPGVWEHTVHFDAFKNHSFGEQSQATVSPQEVFSQPLPPDVDRSAEFASVQSNFSEALHIHDTTSDGHLMPTVCSPHLPPRDSRSIPYCPIPPASLLLVDTTSRTSQRRQRKASKLTVPYPSPRPDSRRPTFRAAARSRAIADEGDEEEDCEDEDDGDDYSPAPRHVASSSSLPKKSRTPSSSPSPNNSQGATKFPHKFQCHFCAKPFTRGTDVTRHLLTCQKNPSAKRRGEVDCKYCGDKAPVRGDSAKRHWRSESCRTGALERGRTPYSGV